MMSHYALSYSLLNQVLYFNNNKKTNYYPHSKITQARKQNTNFLTFNHETSLLIEFKTQTRETDMDRGEQFFLVKDLH